MINWHCVLWKVSRLHLTLTFAAQPVYTDTFLMAARMGQYETLNFCLSFSVQKIVDQVPLVLIRPCCCQSLFLFTAEFRSSYSDFILFVIVNFDTIQVTLLESFSFKR